MAAPDATDTAPMLEVEDHSWQGVQDGRDLQRAGSRSAAFGRLAARVGGIVTCLAAGAVLWQGTGSAGPSLRSNTSGLLEDFRTPAKAAAPAPKAAAPAGGQVAAPPAELQLKYARSMYSAPTAEAFAMLAKLSYCGPLPGISASAVASCGTEAGTACHQAQFRVVPDTVRTFSVMDQDVPDSLFGFAAGLQPMGPNNTVSSGVLISVRGSIDEYTNSVRDKQIDIVRGLLGCEDCGVHKGYHIAYEKLKPQINLALVGLGCTPARCRIYVTGHGAGAAVGSIAAWELFVQNYSVGTSYLFSAPRVGDATFAKKMGETFMGQKAEPMFHVVYGKDSSVRWPFTANYSSWGFEAYYAAAAKPQQPSLAVQPPQICFGGQEGCGIKAVANHELTHVDMCFNPLADNGTLCTFVSYTGTCYHGWSLQAAREAPEQLRGTPQPLESSAASWHPAEQDGKQALAMAKDKNVQHYFSLSTLQAFSALVKIAYCPLTSAMPQTVPNTCNRMAGNRCGSAGFGVVAGTVVPRTVNGTLFFYTALIRRRTAEFAKQPYFMPSEACVLVIRGTTNQDNMIMNLDVVQVPLNDTQCPNCTVNRGIQSAWQQFLEPSVLTALARSGCEANSTKAEVAKKVVIAGHSMGGTLGALAMYWLQKRGFEVQLSWIIEGGRPGNPAFMTYLNEAIVADVRPVPFWLTTHARDGVPRSAPSTFAGGPTGRAQFMVHFPDGSLKSIFCTTNADIAQDSRCGIYDYPRTKLAGWRADDHCGLPFAPSANICTPSLSDCLFGI